MGRLITWARWTLVLSAIALLDLPGISPMRLMARAAHHEIDPDRMQFLAGLIVAQLLTIALAILAGCALNAARTWSVWAARVSAVLLIVFGMPWLLLPGLFVLYALHDHSRCATAPSNPNGAKKLWWVPIIGGGAFVAGVSLIAEYAPVWGLPPSYLGQWIIVVLLAGEWIEVTVHEFGHTLAAWAVGFRVRTFCVGPLLIYNDAQKGRRVHFQWQRLLMVQGGYVGCIPTKDEGVRGNMIFVVLCGPLIAIIAGIGFFSLALASPGTALEPYWEVPAILALLFVIDSLVNLIPAGNLDGAHLLHLILWTERGKAYVASLRSGKLHEDAKAIRSSGDLEGEVEVLERALKEAVDGGERRPDALATHHLHLGFGLLRVQRWADAEAQLKKSVDYLESGVFNPGLEANSWMGLHSVYRVTHRADEAERAYAASVAAFRKVLDRRIPRTSACSIRGAIGRLHVDEGQYDAGLDELERALESCPVGAAHLMDRAILFRSRAECQFLMGMPDRGMEDANRAAKIFRAAVAGDTEAPKALGELGALALVVWKSGRWRRAADLLQEAVDGFEARGLTARASTHRLLLSLIFRKAGRLDDALIALPSEEDLPISARENGLLSRGYIALLCGRIEEAIADFEEAVSLARQAADPRPARIAEFEAALAEAYLEAGRNGEAEALATGARTALQEAQNPDESDALLVLARLAWKRGEDGSTHWRRAVDVMQTARLIESATRARWLEQTAVKLARDARFAEAEEARNSAAVDWNRLGCPLETVQHQIHHDAGYAHVHPDR